MIIFMKTLFKKTLPIFLLALCAVSFLPLLADSALAASGGTTATGYCSSGVPETLIGDSKNVADLVKYVVCFLQGFIIPFIFALSICVFIYGMVKFIGTEESSEREQGKQFMLWGIIALAVMFSVWGIVAILRNTFGVTGNVIPQLPVN